MFAVNRGAGANTQKTAKARPYYQLSFTVDGKSSSLFVKKEDLKTLRDCAKRYQKFRALNTGF